MVIPRKLWLSQFFIDTNRINSRGRLSNMNLLERWHRDGVISLRMPWDAQLEAERGNESQRQKAWTYIAPLPFPTTQEEKHDLLRIQQTIFGNHILNDRQRRDALIVFTAKKYFAILITADGRSRTQPRGILGAAKELHYDLGVQVMCDDDVVMMIRSNIEIRDRMIRADTRLKGMPEPEWCGCD